MMVFAFLKGSIEDWANEESENVDNRRISNKKLDEILILVKIYFNKYLQNMYLICTL